MPLSGKAPQSHVMWLGFLFPVRLAVMSTPTLTRIRIAPNGYGLSLMRTFERHSPFAAPLAAALARECETGSRALYLGLLGEHGELLARARLVLDSLKVILVDELEAMPGYEALLPELVAFATAEAMARNRPLAVMVAEDDVPDWAALGFGETGMRLLIRLQRT